MGTGESSRNDFKVGEKVAEDVNSDKEATRRSVCLTFRPQICDDDNVGPV